MESVTARAAAFRPPYFMATRWDEFRRTSTRHIREEDRRSLNILNLWARYIAAVSRAPSRLLRGESGVGKAVFAHCCALMPTPSKVRTTPAEKRRFILQSSVS